jgi:hypothetical protein
LYKEGTEMKRISYVVSWFLLTIFLFNIAIVNCASSASNKQAILGKWEFAESDQGGTVEFLKNGRPLQKTKEGDILPGTYNFLDDNRLQSIMCYGIWEVNINNGELSLKQLDRINNGKIMKLKMIK